MARRRYYDPGLSALTLFVLGRAIASIYRGVTQRLVFGFSARHTGSPVFKGSWFQFLAHESNGVGLGQAKLLFDGFERRAVFPGHLDYARYSLGCRGN